MNQDKPLYDPLGNRVKFNAPKAIYSLEELARLIEEMDKVAKQNGATRQSLRILVGNSILPNLRSLAKEFRYVIESIVGLNMRFSGYSLVYLGKNESKRWPTAMIVRSQQELLDEAQKNAQLNFQSKVSSIKELGFEVEYLVSPSPDDEEQIKAIFKENFKFFPENLERTLGSKIIQPDRFRFYVLRSKLDQKIYSFLIMEKSTITTYSQESFSIWETFCSAKIPFVMKSGKTIPVIGMSSVLHFVMFHDAVKNNSDLVLSESRAAQKGPNKINSSMGMIYSGFLPKHTYMNHSYEDVAESRTLRNGDFSNLNVWSLNRGQLLQLVKRISPMVDIASSQSAKIGQQSS